MNPWDHHYFLITVLNNTSIPAYSFVYKPTTIAARFFSEERAELQASKQTVHRTHSRSRLVQNKPDTRSDIFVCVFKDPGASFHRQRKMEPEEETQVSIKEAILIMLITFRVDLRKLERIDPRNKNVAS